MKGTRALGAELLGLFVDDGPFALGILVCVALAAAGARATGNAAWWAPLLFAGLSLNFLASIANATKRRPPGR